MFKIILPGWPNPVKASGCNNSAVPADVRVQMVESSCFQHESPSPGFFIKVK